MNKEEYDMVLDGTVCADRMALGLPAITDRLRGDMDAVKHWRDKCDKCVKIAEDEETEAAPKGGEVSDKCLPDDKIKAYWNGYWSAAHNIAADINKARLAEPANVVREPSRTHDTQQPKT